MRNAPLFLCKETLKNSKETVKCNPYPSAKQGRNNADTAFFGIKKNATILYQSLRLDVSLLLKIDDIENGYEVCSVWQIGIGLAVL